MRTKLGSFIYFILFSLFSPIMYSYWVQIPQLRSEPEKAFPSEKNPNPNPNLNANPANLESSAPLYPLEAFLVDS